MIKTILSLSKDAATLVAAKAALYDDAKGLLLAARQAQTEAIRRALPGHPAGAVPVDTEELARELAELKKRSEALGEQLKAFGESLPEEVKVPVNAVWRSHATYMTATQWEGWLEAGWTPAWGEPKTKYDSVSSDYVYGANYPVRYSGNASRCRSTAALFGRGPMAAGTVAPPKGGELAEALIALACARWLGSPCEIASTAGVLEHIQKMNIAAYQNRRRIRRHLRKRGVTPLD